MVEFLNEVLKDMKDVVRDAIERYDKERLRGLQSLGMSIWTKVRGCKGILAVMFERTLDERARRKKELGKRDIKLEIKQKEYELNQLEDERKRLKQQRADDIKIKDIEIKILETKREILNLQEITDKIVKIDWFVLRSACSDLDRGQFILFLESLVNNKFIHLYQDPLTGKNDKIALSSIWEPVLKDYENNRKQVSVFTEGIGSLLGMSILEMGVASFRPVILMVEHAKKNNGKIKNSDASDIFYGVGLSRRRFSDYVSSDKHRPKEIRFITEDLGDEYIINQEAIRAWDFSRDWTNGRLLGRSRGP